MKKFILATIAILFVVPVTACSSDPAPAQPAAPTVEQPYEPPVVSQDDRFIEIVNRRAPITLSTADSSLVSLAQSICSSLRSGVPIETVLEIGLNSGLDTNTVATVTAASVVVYCPEQQ